MKRMFGLFASAATAVAPAANTLAINEHFIILSFISASFVFSCCPRLSKRSYNPFENRYRAVEEALPTGA